MTFLKLRSVGATLHWGPWASHCRAFSSCRAPALGRWSFSGCGTRAQLLWLRGLVAPWDLPGSGIKPGSPALVGGFLTEPPGKPLQYCFCFMFWFFGHKASEILALWPGIWPPPHLAGKVLTTGPAEKSLCFLRCSQWNQGRQSGGGATGNRNKPSNNPNKEIRAKVIQRLLSEKPRCETSYIKKKR